jgi:NitT/TauT family transport system substrate-binding protein
MMHITRKGFGRRSLAALGACAVLVAVPSAASASAHKAKPKKPKPVTVTLVLNGPAAGSSAGFMYAKALGLYTKAGLDVHILESGGSALAAAALAANKASFAFADGPTLMLTAAKGAKIKILSIVHENNGFAVISQQKTNINRIGDLAGKTVAVVPGSAQTNLFNAVLETNGLNPSQVKTQAVDGSALAAALASGQVDAFLGAAVYHSVLMREQGFKVSDLLFADAGVPTFGLSIATSDALIKGRPGLVRAFVQASLQGWDRLRTHVAAAAQAIYDQFPNSGTLGNFTDMTQAVVKNSLCAPGSRTVGWPAQSEVDATFQQMVKYQGLPASPSVSSYYTKAFLPKKLPACKSSR